MKYVTSLVIALLLTGTLIYTHKEKAGAPTVGSVNFANEYQGTTTDVTWAVAPFTRVLKTGNGTLGSVVVTITGTGSINLYDATTTNILQRTNNVATSSIRLGSFTAPTVGTYTFDTAFYTGLLAETTGSIASTTITYR